MGNHFQTVVDLDATAEEAQDLAAAVLDWLVGEGIVRAELTDCVLGAPLGHPPGPRWDRAVVEADWEPTDGLRIETGRTVFDCGQGDVSFATCPHCAGQVDLDGEDGPWESFREAIEDWHATGDAAVGCPLCGRTAELPAWRWQDDYFAFAYLGFEFWDWPEFAPAFLDRFAAALGGHRTLLVGGKL